MEIVFVVLQGIWLLLPGAFANGAPVLFKNTLTFLAVPVDGGVQFHGKPLFGKNKTVRGFVTGIFVAMVICFVQSFLFTRFAWAREISIVDYTKHSFLLVGFLMGFGVLLGDLIESFIKRQLAIPPGGKFFPWDQLDALIGGLGLLALIVIPPWQVILFLLLFVPLLHLTTNRIAYMTGLKDRPW